MNTGKCILIAISGLFLFMIGKCSYNKLTEIPESERPINIEYVYLDRNGTYHVKIQCPAMFLAVSDSLNSNYDMGILRETYISNVDSCYFCSMCVSDRVYKHIKEHFTLSNNKNNTPITN